MEDYGGKALLTWGPQPSPLIREAIKHGHQRPNLDQPEPI